MKNRHGLCMAGLFLLSALSAAGCGSIEDVKELATVPEPVVIEVDRGGRQTQDAGAAGAQAAEDSPSAGGRDAAPDADSGGPILIPAPEPDPPERDPVQARGIYLSAYAAGNPSLIDAVMEKIDRSEINTLVIDFKTDEGRISCRTGSEMIQELGAELIAIPDIEDLMETLHGHGVYAIARVPAFRDTWLAEARPDLAAALPDGSVFYDRSGNAWLNPYKTEVWDYLVEVGRQAGLCGFDEVQFDYVRFCTERGMNEVVFDEEDVRGRSRTQIIEEFTAYACEALKKEGLFVSADVFGAVMVSEEDQEAVGQDYAALARHLDYICPMIYPSHFADGYFGIDYPDTRPYDTIFAAMMVSKELLDGEKAGPGFSSAEAGGNEDTGAPGEVPAVGSGQEGQAAGAGQKEQEAGTEEAHTAVVRPWLQDFTASWLKNYIPYGGEEVRAQIQAVYDSGSGEWLLWDASCSYDWDGILFKDEEDSP